MKTPIYRINISVVLVINEIFYIFVFKAMRSRLRPYGIVMTEVPMTINEKNTKIKQSEDDAKADERRALKDPLKQPIMTLDPHMFNEVEFINLSKDSKMLCLKE